MTRRTRASAKAAGTRFESSVAAYLAEHVDQRIERRARTGAKDRGDLSGLRHSGGRILVECKDYGGRLLPGPWLAEAEVERGNDDALAGLVVAKRRGKGDPGDQVVIIALRDLVALLTGSRPEEPAQGPATAPSPAPLVSCACGHVRRIHGPRPGLDDAGPGCRACACQSFGATS